MPGFADWLPGDGNTLFVGRGGYSSDNANAHLKFIGKRLNLNVNFELKALGSTWYGPTKLMRATARLTLEVLLFTISII